MTIERQLRLWDDRIVWLELLATPFPGEENRRFMLVIVRDITARKRIEEKIILLNTALENRLQDRLAELDVMNTRLSAEMRERIESEEWIRNFLQYCPIVMYIKDARACMVMANKNFESMFGMNPSAIIGKTNKEVWGEELGEVIDRQDFDVLKNAAPKEYLDTINGRNFLTIKFPIVRKDLPPLLGSYVQDVTEIIAEERAMKLSRQFFERIVNALGDLVCVKDVARRYVLVNDSFVDFVGIDRQDIIGKSDRELFDPDIAEMIESGDDAVFEKQREFLIEELLPRRDGTQRRILVKKDIYFDEHDQPFIVNVIRDITELRQEEEEIRTALAREKELSELKSRFVSMVSHEYKTPLTAILSSAELLELFRKSWSDEKVNGHLQKIKRAVETMIEMISDALFLNKMDTGRLIVSPNTFELVSFCIMIADEIQACAPVQNKIEFSSNVTNVVVSVDNKLLRYIFTNLLSNAVKYSYADSPIQFELAISGQSGIFRIRNRGIGIPQSHRERLFEPFFRAPNTGTIQGTGLGLSIVKRCVDSLQGTIEVDSEQNGETMFTVTVPMPLLKQRPGVAYTKGAASD
jgi:PAS domain S-box-containing protein